MIPARAVRGIRLLTRNYRGFEPDARRFLLVTLVSGAALSLWWIDFNLYLASLGFDTARIGIIATAGSVAGAIASFPASSLSDRYGRRLVMIGGGTMSLVAVTAMLGTLDPTLILLLAAMFAAGDQAVHVVAVPYLSEHSSAEHRNELFAVQHAISSATNILAAALGGVVARLLAENLGFTADGPDTYRIILVFMVGLICVGLVLMLRLTDDRPARAQRSDPGSVDETPARRWARRSSRPGWSAARLGLTIRDRRTFARLLLPGFIISVGAGQVIPFLNLFVRQKFGLDLAALNGAFAITSIGTMVAILYQPTLARRLGRLRSVVLVQGASIPFLIVLGFSPILWTAIAAMAVRNSLMNAGNPIFNAFAMDQVRPAERATLAAAMSLLWSVGWVVAGLYYSAVHAALDFDAGYTVNFATIIVLYSIATWLYWRWFRDADRAHPDAASEPLGTGPQQAMGATTD